MPYPIFGLLTLERMEELPMGVFATGTVSDNPYGVHMTGSDRLLRWVAVKRQVDWCIYIHWAESSEEYIEKSGDKLYNEKYIKKLVECTDEAFGRYGW